ncbi:hypothetical protein ACVW00_000366 [Marmoricola sp. URHA0025 HA25]
MSNHFYPVEGLGDGSLPRPDGHTYRAPRRRFGILAGSAAFVIGLAGGTFILGQIAAVEHQPGSGTSQSAAQSAAPDEAAPSAGVPAPTGEGQEHESD